MAEAHAPYATSFRIEAARLVRSTDDRGQRYDAPSGGAAGEGARRDRRWRLTCRCFPALPRNAMLLGFCVGCFPYYQFKVNRIRTMRWLGS